MSENVYAGNAMIRRAMYMVAAVLPSPTLITPTDLITHTGQKITIDGLEFEFLMAPGSEAPSEMHFYTPALKALRT